MQTVRDINRAAAAGFQQFQISNKKEGGVAATKKSMHQNICVSSDGTCEMSVNRGSKAIVRPLRLELIP